MLQTMPDERPPTLANYRTELALAGLAMVLLVTNVVFAFLIPQTPARLERASAGLISQFGLWSAVAPAGWDILQNPHAVAALLIACTGVSFASYALAIVLSWRQRPNRLHLGIIAAGFTVNALVGALALPTMDTDIFNYIVAARVGTEYGENPQYVPPDRYPDDPLYHYASTRYTDVPAADKLPAWTLVNLALATAGGDDPLTALLVYRFGLLALNVASVILLGLALHRMASPHVIAGLIIYGWNPIVTLRAPGKPDTLMVFFVALAAWWFTMPRLRRWAVVPLTLATLVKLIPLPLLAIAIIATLHRNGWRAALPQAGLTGITAAAVYLPFVEDLSLFERHIGLLGRAGSSLPAVLAPVITGGFIVLVLVTSLTRRDSPPDLFRGWALTLAYFAVFVSELAYSWYLLVPIAVVSLAGWYNLALVMIPISAASFLLNLWESTSNRRFPLAELDAPRVLAFMLMTGSILGLVWLVQRLWPRLSTRPPAA